MPDLLSEASALGDQLHGAPTEAAPMPSSDLTMIEPRYAADPSPPAPAVDEPDSAAREPYDFVARGIDLEDMLHGVVPDLGPTGPANIATALRVLPRDVVKLVDGDGLPLGVLAEIGANLGGDGVMPGELDVDQVAAHAAEAGIGGDLLEAAHVSCLLNALPARICSGITPEMAADPALWALAVDLGRKLGSFELRRPLKGAK